MVNIEIYSFGYRSCGIPANEWGDGGGFVFDCRFLPNPYHIPELKNFTGCDKSVIDYFSKIAEVDIFIDQCLKMVETAAKKYSERGFKHLQVSFGCTGGQHRSVYCSEKIAAMLKGKNFSVNLIHTEIDDFS